MSILAVDVGDTAVTAVVVGDTGVLEASSRGELARHAPAPGRLEYAPEELWQTTLAVTRAVLARVDRAALRAVGVTNQPGTVLLWDRETLGSPRRALAGLAGPAGEPDSVGARLSWIADHEPRTWALVEEGRYAVGTVDSYLVARMTRGTWHVTDVANASATALLDLGTGDWSDESCAEHGVPRDALPEVVDSWGTLGTTDRASYCGLDLPITGLVGEGPATLFGQACFDLGEFRHIGVVRHLPDRHVPPATGVPTARDH